MTMRTLTPETLAGLLGGPEELAILDAREEGEFACSHLFRAVPSPLSRADLVARRLLPSRSTPIVAVDAGEGHADALAATLRRFGYADLAVLEGGIAAWHAAGFELFSGVNVPSKAFGEWAEHHYCTESIDPAELKRRSDSGAPMIILDSRTFEEFTRMNIPGGISVPGGELVYRIAELAPDPATLVVVNCAGRTRSILGAESLRRAGIPNQVLALRNGTMGWELAGFRCERGATRRYPAGTPASLPLGLARASRFAREAGVKVIDRAAFSALAADQARSLYLLDVRSPEEYRAGHLAGSLSAPGGQLIQTTDRWIAVRGARVALIDDTGVRARMAGAWLRQMAPLEAFVVEGALDETPGDRLETGPEPRLEPPSVPEVSVAELRAWQQQPGTMVVDCAESLVYRAGHIPGAIWAIRSRLAVQAEALARATRVAITSPDGWLAAHTVVAAAALTRAPVHALRGGTGAWEGAGHRLLASPDEPPDFACIDVQLRPYDRSSGAENAMRAYLSWEVGLPAQLAREPQVNFGIPPAHARF
ncbi:MAG: rhodanese-like domain-containing protein [Acetobacteraceae bacterium]